MRPDFLATSRTLLAIRKAQSFAASADLVRQQKNLRGVEGRVESARDLQLEREGHWARMLSAVAIDLESSRAWAAAILDGDVLTRRLSEDEVEARRRCVEARGELRAAQAREQAVEALDRRERRKVRQRAEDAATADASDRDSSRWPLR